MSKMDEGQLLRFLRGEADAAFAYIAGPISEERETALRAYMREPYGTEQDGRSQVISSDVFDMVEGMLPDLVDVFTSSDKAVVFDPVGPEDVETAKQVTDACNYVFYKQNNGFMTLYTAAKDALLMKIGAVHWYWEEKKTPTFTTYKNVTEMQLAVFLSTNPDAEVMEKDEYDLDDSDDLQEMLDNGIDPASPMKVYECVKIKTMKEKGRVRIVNIPPDELQVSRRHNSILLHDCPYVARVTNLTASEIREMGYDVTDDEVKAAHDEPTTADRELRDTLKGGRYGWWDLENPEDPSSARGWLRDEYVLVDYDGDGIAERRRIVRLGDKILENVEFSHVPIAAWTPYILTHRFEGISVADLVEDFQRISTDITRAQLDNLDLANNQETVVLTGRDGAPQANIDDLLNRRPGGILREYQQGAIRPYMERWQGIEAMPMLQVLENQKEKRTGFSSVVPGIDADALNKTATEVSKQANDKQKRSKMMARIMAEALVAPMFRGIFKTLSDYCMEKLVVRLGDQFQQYDPQEWRDQYDMTINVGIGTGDKMLQMAQMREIVQQQLGLMASPMAGRVVTEQNIYNSLTRMAEQAGYKNPREFWNDPAQVPPPQPQPNPQIQIEQAKLQGAMQLKQLELQDSAHKFQAEQTLQQQTDANRQEWEARQKTLELQQQAEIERMKQEFENQREAMRLEFERWRVEVVELNKRQTADQSHSVDIANSFGKVATQMQQVNDGTAQSGG